MNNISQTEENYLKAIFKICENEEKPASTNALAAALNTSAASVSDMLKRLAGKSLIFYEKHRGVTLTGDGNKMATMLIRKHRLWEVFLMKTLQFSWDEVHDMAEQLEHIHSPELVRRLDNFLGNPKFDPHGDPIPDAEGVFTERNHILLSQLKVGEKGVIVGVQEHSPTFLQYLDKMEMKLGTNLEVLERFDFDESIRMLLNEAQEITISSKVSQGLLVLKAN